MWKNIWILYGCRNPGGNPEWLGSVILAVYISAVVCLTLVYLLSYVHISGAKNLIAIANVIVFVLSLTAVISGLIPPFTEDVSRAVNVSFCSYLILRHFSQLSSK